MVFFLFLCCPIKCMTGLDMGNNDDLGESEIMIKITEVDN